MTALLFLLLLLLLHSASSQPSPGYYPSSNVAVVRFNQLFENQWGPQHQTVTTDQLSASIQLDNTSGSGFKSTGSYQNGYFGASIKLQRGYTAGVNNAFYLSNGEEYQGFHDEIDFEILGTIPGQPYTVETNVYMRGNSERNATDGREVKFHLWFDPTADFHHYAILWNPDQIVFFVDDIPIRQYPRKSDNTFPLSPMWAYGSIWDASSWATDNGQYKVDYRYQPFVANFTNFKVTGCAAQSGSGCGPMHASPSGPGLSPEQLAAMTWARNNYMIYDYCSDPKRDHSLKPEC